MFLFKHCGWKKMSVEFFKKAFEFSYWIHFPWLCLQKISPRKIFSSFQSIFILIGQKRIILLMFAFKFNSILGRNHMHLLGEQSLFSMRNLLPLPERRIWKFRWDRAVSPIFPAFTPLLMVDISRGWSLNERSWNCIARI